MKYIKCLVKNKWKALSLTFIIYCSCFLMSCSDDFLNPKPLSFYEPEATFTTESGLQAALATCDSHIKRYWVTGGNLITEYTQSELAVLGKTDDKNLPTDYSTLLTPTTMKNQTNWFWEEGYLGVMYANTVISFVEKVGNLNETTKNMYLGRAYFHRSFRYLMLVFQFGDIPLVTKLLEVPKQNYYSTKKEAILEKITKDMEFAVEWVPDQKDMDRIGMINKAACRQLLIKCYLATGQFQKAVDQANILIDQSGFALMKKSFGTFISGGEPATWKITPNVIWDLHRPENKLISANTEVLLGIVNRGTGDSFMEFLTMRLLGPYYFSTNVLDPNGKRAITDYKRIADQYNNKYDFCRAVGRGIADARATYYATTGMWMKDEGDLRHRSDVGNWFPVDSFKYNDPASPYYGKTFKEVPPNFSTDTVRTLFPFPLYKIYLLDADAESKPGDAWFDGATKGSVADWYIYRLAETYLLRAEAYYYLGKTDLAAKDVDEVRKRAECKVLYSDTKGSVNIGDIMDERARELYLEEFRHAELSRVSHCLALSGKPDEWGNTYDVKTYCKEEGTNSTGGSYWYQRVIKYNGFYNTGIPVIANKNTYNYMVGKHNLYWPIPNAAITKNIKGKLRQNVGYEGYDPTVPVFETWEEAVADEDKVD